MALDPVKNFAISRVATAPSPADSGTTLVVETGDGVLFPDPSSSGEYNVVIYPNGEQPTSTNAEIVRVTARTSDTMTIEREQESTSARTIVEGDVVMLGITAKVVEDIQDIADAADAKITDFNGGWIDANETWTYASADDPTYTFTVAADVTTKYSAGMKIKLTQGTVKYFIITAVSAFSGGNTTITVYGGTDYDLTSATITENYYSTQKAPFGFPMSPAKWSVETTSTSDLYIISPTAGTWTNTGAISIVIPVGVWSVAYKVTNYSERAGGVSGVKVTLSSTNNSQSNALYTTIRRGSVDGMGATTSAFFITLTSKTTHYINITATDANQSSIGIQASFGGTHFVRATCAYL